MVLRCFICPGTSPKSGYRNLNCLTSSKDIKVPERVQNRAIETRARAPCARRSCVPERVQNRAIETRESGSQGHTGANRPGTSPKSGYRNAGAPRGGEIILILSRNESKIGLSKPSSSSLFPPGAFGPGTSPKSGYRNTVAEVLAVFEPRVPERVQNRAIETSRQKRNHQGDPKSRNESKIGLSKPRGWEE